MFFPWLKFLKPNKAPKTNNMHFMFAPFLYVAAWRIPLTNINTRTVTWSAVIQLNKCSYRQQVSLLSFIQDMTHWTWLNPNAANIYILEQTNLNKGITIRWMHQDRSVKTHKTLQNSVNPGPVATFNFLPAAKTISIQVSGNSMTCHLKNVHTRCTSPHQESQTANTLRWKERILLSQADLLVVYPSVSDRKTVFYMQTFWITLCVGERDGFVPKTEDSLKHWYSL